MTQTIALIDDDRNILTGISIALEREGFKVQTYIDGESALIGFSSCRYQNAKNGWRRVIKKIKKKNVNSYYFFNLKR